METIKIMRKILVVDDEKNVLSSFRKIFVKEGYDIATARSAEEGLELAQKEALDLLIMDIKMPGGLSGLEVLARFKALDARLPVIIMTAFGTTETAIEAMQQGAYDYVLKPFDVPKMKEVIESALAASLLMKTEVVYEPKTESVYAADKIVGASLGMQEIYKTIGQIAANDITVLLRGESGTGKELIARAIYQHSARRNKPFFVINSAAIPETLLESELFGYEKGAFTDAKEQRIGKLEQCNGGTFFLDEIGDMPQSIQTKLLRVLENKSFERLGGNKIIKTDVRLIAATNKDLEGLIKDGKFREDLYYRLNVVTIRIPALRERRDDISLLAEYFLARYAKEFKKEGIKISERALQALCAYSWPGNVRELENAIKKAILFNKGKVILEDDIAFIKSSAGQGKEIALSDAISSLVGKSLQSGTSALYKHVVEEAEKHLIIEVLKQVNGNQSEAAKILGISRPTLKDKIEKLGLRKVVTLQETP